jgi:hypothetical protein
MSQELADYEQMTDGPKIDEAGTAIIASDGLSTVCPAFQQFIRFLQLSKKTDSGQTRSTIVS